MAARGSLGAGAWPPPARRGVVETATATAPAEGGDRSCRVSRSHAVAGIIATTAKNITTVCLRTHPPEAAIRPAAVTFLGRHQMLNLTEQPRRQAPGLTLIKRVGWGSKADASTKADG